MKALDVECPVCGQEAGHPCYIADRNIRGVATMVPLGHAHGGRSRLVAIRTTLSGAEHLALDSEADRRALELLLVEALS